jgi:hypothetical protein
MKTAEIPVIGEEIRDAVFPAEGCYLSIEGQIPGCFGYQKHLPEVMERTHPWIEQPDARALQQELYPVDSILQG